jgi:hypothetical protein
VGDRGFFVLQTPMVTGFWNCYPELAGEAVKTLLHSWILLLETSCGTIGNTSAIGSCNHEWTISVWLNFRIWEVLSVNGRLTGSALLCLSVEITLKKSV